MIVAAGLLQGAAGRLLPPSVPFRFFTLAVLSHVAFWAALGAAAGQLADFRGGFAPLLAAVHLLTIGVLLCTAMGAAVQILPIVTRRPLAAIWPVKLVFWLLLPGLILMVAGFHAARPGLAGLGGSVAAAGLFLFAAVLADTLRRAAGPPVVVAYGWAALVALIATVLLGLRLVADFSSGGGAAHGALALGHLILGGFGVMGLFALGFGHVLVPMFALAAVPDRRLAWAGFAVTTLSVVLGAAAAVGPVPAALPAAAVLGVVACGIHLWLMRQALRAGMRRRLGISFVLVRGAWVLMAVTLGAGLVCTLAGPGRRGPALFAVLLFGGWLLTFLLGILQRILPMLASMHVAAALRQGPGTAAEGAQARLLQLHACCHGLALAAVGGGIVGGVASLVQAGSAVGLVGAIAFALYALNVLRGVWRGVRRAATLHGRPAS